MNQSEKNNVCLFVRVSTDKQDYQRQINELNEYCTQKGFNITKTIATQISGTKTDKNRPDIKELFEAAKQKQFNKVVVCEISRLGRVAKDIRNTIDFLHKLKIPIIFKNLGGLESISENGNESFVTNIIIAIYSELAQEEKRLLSERVKSGLQNALKNGKIIGRAKGSIKNKKKLLKEYSKLAEDLKKGFSLNQCVKLHNVSKNTVLKVKNMLKNE
ncbi:MAG: recombinase family protein [Bacteroidales bacterium]|jgi:DNA invertase Pin-like site-specific DNA recombinase